MKRIKLSLTLIAGLLVGSAYGPASAGPQPQPQPQPQPAFDVYQFCASLTTYPGDCVYDITHDTVPNNIPLYGTPPPDAVYGSATVTADTGG